MREKRGDGDYDEDGTRTTIFSIAELSGGIESKRPAARLGDEEAPGKSGSGDDNVITHERSDSADGTSVATDKKQVLLQGINRPLFHFDLQEAVEAAIADAKTKTFK